MNTTQFKFMPLRQSDFKNQVGYNVKTHLMPTFSWLYKPHKCSYGDILNKLGEYLFPKFDYSNITKTQLIRLNKLLKIGFEIIEQYAPSEMHSNMCVNLFSVYLQMAIIEFYKQNAPAEHLQNARNRQNANNKRKQIKFGQNTYAERVVYSNQFEQKNVPSHYVSLETVTFMRPRFFKEFNAYPDEIYIAIVFFMVPYIIGIRKTNCKCDNKTISSVLKSVFQFRNKHLCGLGNKDDISFDFVAEYFEKPGKAYTNTKAVKDDLVEEFKLSSRQIKAFITYFNNKHHLTRIRDFWKKS